MYWEKIAAGEEPSCSLLLLDGSGEWRHLGSTAKSLDYFHVEPLIFFPVGERRTSANAWTMVTFKRLHELCQDAA